MKIFAFLFASALAYPQLSNQTEQYSNQVEQETNQVEQVSDQTEQVRASEEKYLLIRLRFRTKLNKSRTRSSK